VRCHRQASGPKVRELLQRMSDLQRRVEGLSEALQAVLGGTNQ
jgi:hypothetical protein